MTTIKETPMMTQWHACKKSAKECLLFFRLGDFYEAFEEDAIIMAKELSLTLTKRQEIPMAGVPAHTAETYIDRLVAKGYRVAVAEQVEDPKQAQGIVKREVVRIVTPGTVVNSSLLADKESNYLAACTHLNHSWGVALIDITTAELYAFECENGQELLDRLAHANPKELLFPETWKEGEKELLRECKELSSSPTCHFKEKWHFDHQSALDLLLNHFNVHSLDGFGLKGQLAAINAAGALLAYIRDDLQLPTMHIRTLKTNSQSAFMYIDQATARHLELTQPQRQGEKEATLIDLIDETKTPMGGRLLRKWLNQPLLSASGIRSRQISVEAFYTHFSSLLKLRSALDPIRDLERIIMRIETGFASPRDLSALSFSLFAIPKVIETLLPFETPLIQTHQDALGDPTPIARLIATALVDEPPMRLSDGGVFRPGYHARLDELTAIKSSSKKWIQNYQIQLRQETGIKTLKVGFTRVFGYYIEVSKAAAIRMPESFHRRQTLVNNERYVTETLKTFEHKILSADEQISALEAELFHALRLEIASHAQKVRESADALAHIDCLSGLAKLAKERNYVCPLVDESDSFEVEEARHPIIETTLAGTFIPNDIQFGAGKRLALITGPNMAGKSTYLREAALIAILAQMGSFVPAQKAHIGLIDKVFSRIGASDDLTRGQSTFMVEMTEAANILNNATNRSFVILDEIGRGTSTFDGISIAWAIAEYLLTTPGKKAKTLFATHYLELTELAEKIPGAFNLSVSIHEEKGEIIFLHKIIPGSADKSYGIHVARLAGLPHEALRRAEEKLIELETTVPVPPKTAQLELFSPQQEKPCPRCEEIENLDLNSLTPIESLRKLFDLKNR